MITLTSKQTQIRTILVSLLLGPRSRPLAEAFILADRPFATTGRERSGSRQGSGPVTGRSREKFAITRRIRSVTCSYSSAIPGYGATSSIPAKTARAQLFTRRYPET